MPLQTFYGLKVAGVSLYVTSSPFFVINWEHTVTWSRLDGLWGITLCTCESVYLNIFLHLFSLGLSNSNINLPGREDQGPISPSAQLQDKNANNHNSSNSAPIENGNQISNGNGTQEVKGDEACEDCTPNTGSHALTRNNLQLHVLKHTNQFRLHILKMCLGIVTHTHTHTHRYIFIYMIYKCGQHC